MMPFGLWVVVGWMAFVIATGIGFLIWGWKHRQFRDIEEPKYRMLEDRDPLPWSEGEGGNS
jgi:nitrogen fixation-related uncharacterized protein